MSVIVGLRLTEEEKERWTGLAKAADPPMSLSAWIRAKCSVPGNDGLWPIETPCFGDVLRVEVPSSGVPEFSE